MGYHRAGFEVVGIDIEPQPNYPFEFIRGDALKLIPEMASDIDAIHASPPCQEASKSTAVAKSKGKEYPDLIPATRKVLSTAGRPFIIENVPQARIKPDVVLTGQMFGLRVIRQRHFEISPTFMLNPCPAKKKGSVKNGDLVSPFGKASWKNSSRQDTPATFANGRTIRETWAYAMGIDWHLTDIEVSEAIPPAYTEYIGQFLIEYLQKNPDQQARA